jgi:hypothetical protein
MQVRPLSVTRYSSFSHHFGPCARQEMFLTKSQNHAGMWSGGIRDVKCGMLGWAGVVVGMGETKSVYRILSVNFCKSTS